MRHIRATAVVGAAAIGTAASLLAMGAGRADTAPAPFDFSASGSAVALYRPNPGVQYKNVSGEDFADLAVTGAAQGLDGGQVARASSVIEHTTYAKFAGELGYVPDYGGIAARADGATPSQTSTWSGQWMTQEATARIDQAACAAPSTTLVHTDATAAGATLLGGLLRVGAVASTYDASIEPDQTTASTSDRQVVSVASVHIPELTLLGGFVTIQSSVDPEVTAVAGATHATAGWTTPPVFVISALGQTWRIGGAPSLPHSVTLPLGGLTISAGTTLNSQVDGDSAAFEGDALTITVPALPLPLPLPLMASYGASTYDFGELNASADGSSGLAC